MAATLLLTSAAVCYFYTFIGRMVARKYPNLFDDSMFAGVKPTGRFQVMRQRSIVRQRPFWTKSGHVLVAAALAVLLADLVVVR